MICVLLVFLFVLAITALTTRWIGGYQKNQFSNKNLHIIETFRISNNKYIEILKLGEVYLVIAVCKDNVSILAKLTKEELPEIIESDSTSTPNYTENFQEILNKIKNTRSRK